MTFLFKNIKLQDITNLKSNENMHSLISKMIQYDGIGSIEMIKSKKISRMSMKIHPIKGVCVTIPQSWSYKKAEEILQNNSSWVNSAYKKLSATEKKTTPFTEKSTIQTKYRKVKILPWIGRDVSSTLKPEELNIYYPRDRNILDRDIQESIRNILEEYLRKEAKLYLPERLSFLAEKFNFQYKGVSIKNMKSRWGSCTSANQINLSLHLLRIPEELSDYVLLHELCHTVHKNHSAKFWNLLSTVCEEAKKKDKEMRKYRTDIY